MHRNKKALPISGKALTTPRMPRLDHYKLAGSG
jgi:hypothetical protein